MAKVEQIEANFHVFSIFLRVLVAAAAGTAASTIAPQTGKSMSAIRSHPKAFAAGGEVDEVCAHAGVKAIADTIESRKNFREFEIHPLRVNGAG